MSDIWKKAILSLLIFAFSCVAYWYPVHTKGFPPETNYAGLIHARNYALAGTYFSSDANGVTLPSGGVKSSAVTEGILNPLTPVLYGHLFQWVGFYPELPLFTAILAFSAFNVLIFLLIARLFSLLAGLIVSLAGVLMPVMAFGAITGGFYEWGMLFFGFALLLYLGSRKGPFAASEIRIFFSGIFFALAALARSAFAISFLPFLLYDFYLNRSYRKALALLLPFLIIFASTLTPYSWIGVNNGYTSDIEKQPWEQIGHFFPDPYSFHYNRETIIERQLSTPLSRPEVFFAGHWGYKITIIDRIRAYANAATFYVQEVIDLITFGGPIIIAIAFWGGLQMRQKNKDIFRLMVFWALVWLGYLVYAKTGNWDHFLEIIPILLLLLGAAVHYSFLRISQQSRHATFWSIVLIGILCGHLSYAAKWRLHDAYRSSVEERVREVASRVVAVNPGTIMVGIHPSAVYGLNYQTDHATVYFNPSTIEELSGSGLLRGVIQNYGVVGFTGYSDFISDMIEHSGVTLTNLN